MTTSNTRGWQFLRLGATLLATNISAAYAAAPAASNNPMAGMQRFSGTIESVDGPALKVRTTDAGTVSMRLSPSTRIMQRHPTTIAEVGASTFIGCTAVKQADGAMLATECHTFPESLRGLGEGHNPMGPPATTMTNGTVATMTNGEVQSAGGTAGGMLLKIYYQGGTQDIQVTPSTELTRITAVDASAVKPGTRVAGGARAAADGGAEIVIMNVMP